MSLVTPDIGLLFWMLLSFGIVLLLLKKYAWKPILSALSDREKTIQDSLDQAEQARKEIEGMKSDNERILQEARNERDLMLRDARETKDSIVSEAKDAAKQEAESLMERARQEIENEKNAALAELKGHVASLSIEIAEKVIKEKLANDEAQQKLVDRLLDEVELGK